MKKRLQGAVAGLLVGILLMSGTAFAKQTTETIEAFYNNIKIYVDGVKIDPKDANGNTVEPFIYNGTTYLPVRAVGEAIGKTVTWDGATQSVYLGEKPGDVQYLMEVCPPYWTDNYKYETYIGSNGEFFEMGNEKYTNGFILAAASSAHIKLDSKYSSMELTVVSDGSAEGTISFVVDDKTIKTVDMNRGDLPKKITVPLNYGLQLKIINPGGMGSAYNDFGFANIIIQ